MAFPSTGRSLAPASGGSLRGARIDLPQSRRSVSYGEADVVEVGPIASSSMLADDDLAPRYVPPSRILSAEDPSRPMASSSILPSDYTRPVASSAILDYARPVASNSILAGDYERPVASSSILASDYVRPIGSSSVLNSDFATRPVMSSSVLNSDLSPTYVPSQRIRSGNSASITQSEVNPFRSSSMLASEYHAELNPFGSSTLQASELQPPRTGLYTIPSESVLYDQPFYAASMQVPAVAEPTAYQQGESVRGSVEVDRQVYQEPISQEPQVGYMDRFGQGSPGVEPSVQMLQRQLAERFALGDIRVRTVRIEYKEPDYLFPYHNPLAEVGCDFVGHQNELPGHYQDQLEPTLSRVTVH